MSQPPSLGSGGSIQKGAKKLEHPWMDRKPVCPKNSVPSIGSIELGSSLPGSSAPGSSMDGLKPEGRKLEDDRRTFCPVELPFIEDRKAEDGAGRCSLLVDRWSRGSVTWLLLLGRISSRLSTAPPVVRDPPK